MQRKTVRVDDHYGILITTEQLADGWGMVASVRHVDAGTDRVTVPVPPQPFPSESDAEAFRLAQSREWIERNSAARYPSRSVLPSEARTGGRPRPCHEGA